MKKLIKALQFLLVILVLYGVFFIFGDDIRAFYHRHIVSRFTGTAGSPEQRIREAEQCRENLRTIDRAKSAWARAHNKVYGEMVHEDDLLPYLPSANVLKCPTGGRYTLNNYGTLPSCSISVNSTPDITEDNHIIGIR